MRSPDADRILALPHAHHPRLSGLVAALAEKPSMTFETAEAIIQGAARDMRISPLDIEMVQPDASSTVPFVPTVLTTPADDFRQEVADHVRRRLEARR